MLINKTSSTSNKAGFSLIELLLVVMLIPIISMTIFANFSASLKLWKALAHEIPEESLNIFDRKISRDLNNAFMYSPLPFTGEESAITFMTSIRAEENFGGDRGIGQVSYSFDPAQKAIMREEKNVHELYREIPGKKTLLLKDVYSFKVSFFSMDKQEKTFGWKEEWLGTGKELPLALRFEFEFGDSRQILSKTFSLPTGGVRK